jgi:hypothetical protein
MDGLGEGMKTEYGIEKKHLLIRVGFTLQQAKSFIKAKEDASDKADYKIVSRKVGEWE